MQERGIVYFRDDDGVATIIYEAVTDKIMVGQETTDESGVIDPVIGIYFSLLDIYITLRSLNEGGQQKGVVPEVYYYEVEDRVNFAVVFTIKDMHKEKLEEIFCSPINYDDEEKFNFLFSAETEISSQGANTFLDMVKELGYYTVHILIETAEGSRSVWKKKMYKINEGSFANKMFANRSN